MNKIDVVIFPAVFGLPIGVRTFTQENIHEIAPELWSEGSLQYCTLDGEWRIRTPSFRYEHRAWKKISVQEVPKLQRMQALMYG